MGVDGIVPAGDGSRVFTDRDNGIRLFHAEFFNVVNPAAGIRSGTVKLGSVQMHHQGLARGFFHFHASQIGHPVMGVDNVKILLVEDNELNLDIAKYLLTDSGAQVTTVMNGDAAVREFQNTPVGTYDVILMDVMMPVMNGIEATQKIRALAREDAKTIPIIAMTANAFVEDVQAVKNAGMNDHLAKPLEMNKVIHTIGKYLNK